MGETGDGDICVSIQLHSNTGRTKFKFEFEVHCACPSLDSQILDVDVGQARPTRSTAQPKLVRL